MTREPLPYCTPAMLDALRQVAQLGSTNSKQTPVLIARGWVNKYGHVTNAGRAFLASQC